MAKKNLALKIAIVESGKFQADIAEAADLDGTLLSHFVNGRREPNETQRKILARVLKRNVADLFPVAEERA